MPLKLRFRLLLPVLLIALQGLWPVAAQARQVPGAAATAVLERVAMQLGEEVRADSAGSITIAVVAGDTVAWTRSFGWADAEKRVPADAETIYRTGSISKSVTAVVLMRLVEGGIVALDDPVERHFPEIRRLEGYADHPQITYRQLASHTAGLIREPKLEGAAEGPIGSWEEKILASIPTTSFQGPPGAQYAYSNIGFGMLGLALSRAAGRPFMDLVQDLVFAPLGMRSFFILRPEHEAHLAVGYANGNPEAGINAELPAREHAGRGYKVPNGGVYATVSDLARFIAGQTGAAGAGFLSPESRAEMQRVQTPEGQGGRYGLGFSINSVDGLWIVGHGGSVAGYTAYLAFEPEPQLGVVLLRNYNRGKTNLGETAHHLLRDLVKVW